MLKKVKIELINKKINIKLPTFKLNTYKFTKIVLDFLIKKTKKSIETKILFCYN